MKRSEAKRKIEEMQLEMEIDNRASNLNRARSVTVGTAFGGTTEIMMRTDGGRHIWCVMQPVEVIELIHQLAANVGCHLQLKPREDFSSWRDWKVTEEEKLHYNGWAPFVNDLAPHMQIGANMQKYEEEKLAVKINQAIKAQEHQQEETTEDLKLSDNTSEQESNTLDLSKLNDDTTLEELETIMNLHNKTPNNKELQSIKNGQPNVTFENDGSIKKNKTYIKNGREQTLGGSGGNSNDNVKEVIKKSKESNL